MEPGGILFCEENEIITINYIDPSLHDGLNTNNTNFLIWELGTLI